MGFMLYHQMFMRKGMVHKKLLIPCLSLSFSLLSVFFFCVPTSFAAPHDPPSPQPRALCTGTTIPRGWVITDILTDWGQCQGSLLNNVEIVEPPPTTTKLVCYNSPIPAGFVMVNQITDPRHCGSLLANIMTLTPASGASLDVCTSSPIPDGWVITAEFRPIDRPTAVLDCVKDGARGDGFGIAQRTLAAVTGNAMRVCADSPVPSGYQKIDSIALTSCPNDPAGTSSLIAPAL